MGENKSLLLKYAMSYGLALGIYWVVKYIFLILGYRMTSMIYVYEMLSIAVPFIAYYLTDKYRKDIGGKISFFHAWRFGIMLYFFAALIVSIEHFIFYEFIAPKDFIANMMNQAVALFKNMNMDSKIVDSLGSINISPIHMVIQSIFNNIFYGIILSIPVAAIVCRRRTGENIITEKN